MLYFKCHSCKTKLADKQIPIEKEIEEMCNNPKLTDDQKRVTKNNILNKYQVVRYCCRSVVMSYVDLIKVIK